LNPACGLAVLWLICACAKPPVITNIKANPNPVPQNGTSHITATASSPRSEQLSFYWHTAGGGRVNDTRLDTTTYTAPKLSGSYPIALRVLDEHGRAADDTFYIDVGTGR